MIVLLQRVVEASVQVAGEIIAEIGIGLLVYVAAQPNDDEVCCDRAAEKIVAYRIFEDEAGKMNLSAADVQGEILLVPQFTLAADTQHGMRPGFSAAAPPVLAAKLFNRLIECLGARYAAVQSGRFGAEMAVRSVNIGPATFLLQV